MQLLQEQRYLSDFKYAFVIQMGAGGTLRATAQSSSVGIIQMMCKWQCSGKGWVQGRDGHTGEEQRQGEIGDFNYLAIIN